MIGGAISSWSPPAWSESYCSRYSTRAQYETMRGGRMPAQRVDQLVHPSRRQPDARVRRAVIHLQLPVRLRMLHCRTRSSALSERSYGSRGVRMNSGHWPITRVGSSGQQHHSKPVHVVARQPHAVDDQQPPSSVRIGSGRCPTSRASTSAHPDSAGFERPQNSRSGENVMNVMRRCRSSAGPAARTARRSSLETARSCGSTARGKRQPLERPEILSAREPDADGLRICLGAVGDVVSPFQMRHAGVVWCSPTPVPRPCRGCIWARARW